MTEPAPTKKRKGRSPNYPGIDLGLALERAKTLWERERHHDVPNELILKHWGYGPKSGGGSVAFAALKRFGLMEDGGNGRARLTPRALNILLAEREGRRDEVLIREAALLPTMHKEMWDKHRAALPSDENLKFELEMRGFTPGGAAEFLSEWKRTMKYAGLTGDDATVSPNGGETPSVQEPTLMPTPTPTLQEPQEPRTDPPVERERITRTVQVPYSPTGWALVQASFPMTEREWDQMLAVLQAMKLGLVSPDSE
jgi:hypothetical protein